MTGSGSAVFARVPQMQVQEGIAFQAPPDWRMRLCSNLEVHPLSGWAASDD